MGDLTLDGTLVISGLDGFTSGSYPLLTYTGTAVDLGVALDDVTRAVYVGSTITIDSVNKHVVANIGVAFPLAGDYNNDGTVDAADYVVWRKYEGTTTSLPNDPHGGTIGALQFIAWRANFGATAGSASGSGATDSDSAAVPEPASLALLLGALGFLFTVRGRVAAKNRSEVARPFCYGPACPRSAPH